MLVSLTVGKVDAGVAVLLTEDKRLIEFPSILLPPDISTGSIVDVKVSRNHDAEIEANKSFDDLQSSILSTFGSQSPQTPILRCRNATQTSVVLEWDPIVLATANLRSLSLYRNGAKAGVIPRPMEMTSTKISGLAVDTEYTFMLVLRTSAGTYTSEKLTIRTHKMTDLTGITVTPGVMAPELRQGLESTISKIGARIIESVRIDTTHFICTEGRGPGFEKAREMNIPVVLPDWVIGCEREGRLVGVRAYYLDANPKDRLVGPGSGMQRQQSQQNMRQPRPRDSTPERSITPSQGREQSEPPTTNVIPPTPERTREVEGDEDDDDDYGRPVTPRPTVHIASADGVAAFNSASAAAEVLGEEVVDEDDEDDEDDSKEEDQYSTIPNGDSNKESVESERSEAMSSEAESDQSATGKAGKSEDFDDVKL